MRNPPNSPRARGSRLSLSSAAADLCWWTAYDCLKRGWRIWTWRVRIPLEDRDAVLKSWKPFLERAPEGGGFRERLESVLLPRYHAADQVATHYSHAYRSAYALAYFLATFAVFVSLFGTLPFIPHDPPESLTVKAILVVIELAVIGTIIAIVAKDGEAIGTTAGSMRARSPSGCGTDAFSP